jgi:hypothetical protein
MMDNKIANEIKLALVSIAKLQLSDHVVKTVTIAAGGTISTVLNKSGYKYIAIFLPSNWVTSVITFLGCDTENGTFTQVVNSTAAGIITIASVAASKCVVLDGVNVEAMIAVPFIKLVATTTQASTDKVITIILKR